MIILDDVREKVIENIKQAILDEDWYAKVEVNDPVLTSNQRDALLKKVEKRRHTPKYLFNRRMARYLANMASRFVNISTHIEGLEKVEALKGGAIITSNHFSPLENAIVRYMILKAGKKHLNIVSQETNLAMEGMLGYLMNYADIIPISNNRNYMVEFFEPQLKEMLENKEFVLIYPEQEMWFNYKKPRPPKRGPFYYASKLGVPVINCFVEMKNTKKKLEGNFVDVKYKISVLDVMFPDPRKSVRENSIEMRDKDYALKKKAYEKAYGKELTYEFDASDIAGWVPKE
ncbi:MAG: 1-acyl-sn-glycerol-3-phosphate acyltransferase [Eubacterium sp.]|nr:1-acyl-sn-glycerol-3-phosphate acyltransferase [Eubacterium sp.]